ncbi:MAG TPA: hypothetical protein VL137_00535 [Polyangiaceae bacterium]|nr:hypothetical protein [Polyangiaceae bacterium]
MFARRVNAGLLFALMLWSLPGHAGDTPVALDLHYLAPLSKGSGVDSGAGVAVRIGQRFRPAPWVVTPELALAYDSFGGLAEARAYRGLAGLRLGYDFPALRPGLFAHGGVARVTYSPLLSPGADHTSFTYDLGAFLDVTLLPLVNVGAHLGYNQALKKGSNSGTGLKWLALGLHAEIVF